MKVLQLGKFFLLGYITSHIFLTIKLPLLTERRKKKT